MASSGSPRFPVSCFTVANPPPQPSSPQNRDPSFRLDDSELGMFDLYAQESVQPIGAECELFQLNLKKSKMDPLYSEPIERNFDGPYLIRAHIEWPEATPEADEEGMHSVWPSGAWIPRTSIEAVKARPMHEGDVLRFWKLPYFDQAGTHFLENVPGAGFYFEVIKVNDDGHPFDGPGFVAFRCDLKRRSQFAAERLIENR